MSRLNQKQICKLLYRPFDSRYIYYDDVLVARMNKRVLGHFETVNKNLGYILGRQGMATGAAAWDVCFVCNGLVDQNIYRRGGGTVFPLKLTTVGQVLSIDPSRINLPSVVTSAFVDFNSTPEDIFHYAYAVFHSPSYRGRYAEFLKIDFPRLPLTEHLELFRALAKLGGELTALHLLESPTLESLLTKFIGSPSPEVGRVAWSNNTVWLNAPPCKSGAAKQPGTCGFQGVPEEVWNFHIGGYQVCQKWLKDRKGRTLTDEDITHYQKIVVALSETIRLMKEIDTVIDQHGGWPNAFQTSTSQALDNEAIKNEAVDNKEMDSEKPINNPDQPDMFENE